MTTDRVKVVQHMPTIIVEKDLATWQTIVDNAEYSAKKTQDWTIVNLLADVKDALDQELRNDRLA